MGERITVCLHMIGLWLTFGNSTGEIFNSFAGFIIGKSIRPSGGLRLSALSGKKKTRSRSGLRACKLQRFQFQPKGWVHDMIWFPKQTNI